MALKATLTWTASTQGFYPLDTYQIFKKIGAGSPFLLATVSSDTLTYQDQNALTPGTSYNYGVYGVDNQGNTSPESNTITVTPTTDLTSLWGGYSAGNAAAVFITGSAGTIKETPNGTTLVDQVSGTSHNLWGATHAFGHNIAVGDAGTVLTNTAGSAGSWTANNQGSQNLMAVADCPLSTSPGTEVVVAVGANNTILVSQAPASGAWTVNSAGNISSHTLRGVCMQVNNTHLGYIYIVGDNGLVLQTGPTNASGLTYTWTQLTSGTSAQLNAVAATVVGGIKIVAVGNNGVVVTSTNNSTFTLHTLGGGTPNFRAVTYDVLNNVFVVVGDGGVMYTSPDGATWTLGSSGTSNNLLGIYNNTLNAIGSPAFATIAVGAANTIVTRSAPTIISLDSGINSGNGPLFSGEMNGYSNGNISGGPPNYNNGSSVGGLHSGSGTTVNGATVWAICFEDGFGNFKNEVLLAGSHPQNFFTSVGWTSANSGLPESFTTASATYAVATGTNGTFTYWQWNAVSHYPFGFGSNFHVNFT